MGRGKTEEKLEIGGEGLGVDLNKIHRYSSEERHQG